KARLGRVVGSARGEQRGGGGSGGRHAARAGGSRQVGGALLIWLVVEILIVGYSSHPPLQAAYLGLGVVITLIGACWLGQTATRRRAFPRRGATLAGVWIPARQALGARGSRVHRSHAGARYAASRAPVVRVMAPDARRSECSSLAPWV